MFFAPFRNLSAAACYFCHNDANGTEAVIPWRHYYYIVPRPRPRQVRVCGKSGNGRRIDFTTTRLARELEIDDIATQGS